MKATEAKFLDFLRKSPQLVIPIYQRTYSWAEKECRQLWDDIVRTGSNDKLSAHFVGSIVYVEQGLYQVSSQAQLLVIDGQQRLTTVTLLLAALAKALDAMPEDKREPLDGFSPRKIRNYYLVNRDEEGDRFFKLLLSQTDKASLMAIVGDSETRHDAQSSLRVKGNFAMFQGRLAERQGDLVPVCNGLAKLVMVDIALNRDQDNPQLIFESMNSTGRELSQADLIRNYVLMGLPPKPQERLYNDYWRPMELEFGQEAYGTYFDGFMRHYLTMRTGEIPNLQQVYETFKSYARTMSASEDGVADLLQNLLECARSYCAMALGKEEDPDLGIAFHDLRELKVDVAYPFLLELYQDYRHRVLSHDAFVEAVRLTEAYVFRRSVCGLPTNSMSKVFAAFTKGIDKAQYLESIKVYYCDLTSYRAFPNDEDFRRNLQTHDLYNFRSRSYWLRRLENYERKERVAVDEYTIEHILPQNEDLSPEWRASLGTDWQRLQQTYLHTLGNLTLTGYNSEYSDRPFAVKRDMKGGYKNSPLNLNAGLGALSDWNEEAIKTRAAALANLAIRVWAAPRVPDSVLLRNRAKTVTRGHYSISDHPHLHESPTHELFEAFRKETMALDPGVVTEEYLKLYIAYKAETNFVSVEPMAKSLKLRLYMPFADIDDSRGLCRKISASGHWGSGEIEVSLATLDDLPYVMGLIRQSFERQMGNGQ